MSSSLLFSFILLFLKKAVNDFRQTLIPLNGGAGLFYHNKTTGLVWQYEDGFC